MSPEQTLLEDRPRETSDKLVIGNRGLSPIVDWFEVDMKLKNEQQCFSK